MRFERYPYLARANHVGKGEHYKDYERLELMHIFPLSYQTDRFPLPDRSRRSHTRAHSLQPACELWIFLLHFQLCSCCFRVRKCVDDLALCSGQLCCAFEICQCIRDFSLLEEQLCHCSYCNITFGIDWDYCKQENRTLQTGMTHLKAPSGRGLLRP